MKNAGLIYLLIFISQTGLSQTEHNYWEHLTDVTIKTRQQEGYEIEYPVFGDKAVQLDDKVIELKGYIVPLENLLGSNYFMLSSLPFNVCFFCGGAGPETIVEVYTVKEVDFSTEAVVVKGKLILNADDPDHHMYIMKEARIIN